MPNIIGKVIGAGLYKAEIRIATGVVFLIRAVQAISTTPDATVTEVEGEDKKLGGFTFTMAEEAQIQINGVNMDCLQAITGNSYSHSSTSRYALPFGTQGQANPPFFELSGYTRARDLNGVKAEIRRILYKCQIQGGVEFGQSFQEAFSISTTVKAYPTTTDITGVALSEEMISNLDVRGAA